MSYDNSTATKFEVLRYVDIHTELYNEFNITLQSKKISSYN